MKNTGKDNTGINNSGYWNSGNGNSGYWNSGDRNSGDRNSGNGNSGDRNSGDRNSGNGNSTNGENGIFCSKEGTVRLFNKPTKLKWDEIDHPNFVEFCLNKWINKDDMTDKEKEEKEGFNIRGGYLKTFTWKEAWANFWKDTSEENRNKVLNLPNFDAEVFKEITGIDVEVKDDKTEEAMELLKSKGYKIVKN